MQIIKKENQNKTQLQLALDQMENEARKLLEESSIVGWD